MRSTAIESENNNQITPPAPAPPPQKPERIRGHFVADENPEFSPHMLAELEDELARSRMREAFWISVVVHIVIVLLVVFSPQWLPNWAQPHLLRAEDLARTKEPTYLALPQDLQKAPPKVHADKPSDTIRIGSGTHLDKATLDALRHSQTPPPSLPEAAPQMPQPSGPHTQPQPSQPNSQAAASSLPRQMVQPQEQTTANPFKTPLSAGNAIADAARNASHTGNHSGYSAGAQDSSGRFFGGAMLGDTDGVDFGPYVARITPEIDFNTSNLSPESVRPPMTKHGRVTVRFLIMSDGRVTGLSVESSSGDVAIDRAAYGGVLASAPLPPLPHDFHRPYITAHWTFIWNPTTGEIERGE